MFLLFPSPWTSLPAKITYGDLYAEYIGSCATNSFSEDHPMNVPMYINVAAVSLTKSTTHRPKGQWHHLNRAPQSPLSLDNKSCRRQDGYENSLLTFHLTKHTIKNHTRFIKAFLVWKIALSLSRAQISQKSSASQIFSEIASSEAKLQWNGGS